jgi:hypothetical protein
MDRSPLFLRIIPLAFFSSFVFFVANASALSALDRAWAKIDKPGPNLGSREIMGFILEAAGGPDSAQYAPRIEKALRDLEKMQDRDPTSKTYGNFCWYWHEVKPGDRNAVEFVTQQAVLVRMLFASRLTPAARGSVNRLLTTAVKGIHRQQVDIGYTNIFLMKTWNLLALGDALQMPDLSQEGSTMLDQWIAFTSANGIREYLGPTYYGVDLDSVALMSRYLSKPAVRQKAGRILLLLWTDMAANWFEPGGRLGGSHGRDYDYLTGHGELDRHLLDAGWITAQPAAPSTNPANSFKVFAEATRWLPPASLRQEALSDIPRFVFQKWDAPDTAWTSQYIGHQFSIGVTGSSQGPEDKPFALNLAGPAGPNTVMVNFFMDGRNDPYGKNKVATGASGHPKAHHLAPAFNAVQSGPEVLFVASYPETGRKAETEPICLLSQMDLPAEAQVWTADHATDPTLPSEPLPGNICFLRLGNVAVGIRFVLALDTAGNPVTAQVVNDGTAYAARRLTVIHSAGPPGSGRGAVAVWVRAAEGLDDPGFAAFRQSFISAEASAGLEGTVARLKAAGLKGELALDVDLASGALLRSEGADPAMQTPPMSVNGTEFGKKLLQTDAPAGF